MAKYTTCANMLTLFQVLLTAVPMGLLADK